MPRRERKMGAPSRAVLENAFFRVAMEQGCAIASCNCKASKDRWRRIMPPQCSKSWRATSVWFNPKFRQSQRRELSVRILQREPCDESIGKNEASISIEFAQGPPKPLSISPLRFVTKPGLRLGSIRTFLSDFRNHVDVTPCMVDPTALTVMCSYRSDHLEESLPRYNRRRQPREG